MSAPFTPYTNEALARMRAGETASDLGWDEYTYLKRCRHHGIEPAPLRTGCEAVTETGTSIIPSGNPPCQFDRSLGELTRGRAAIALPPRRAEVFAALAQSGGEYFGADQLAEVVGCTRVAAINLVNVLRRNLRALRIAVDSRSYQRGGGYRLVDEVTHEPITVLFDRGIR